jgi:hypothetical protein
MKFIVEYLNVRAGFLFFRVAAANNKMSCTLGENNYTFYLTAI